MLSQKNLLKKLFLSQKLTQHAKNSLAKAELLAEKFKYEEILNLHLLFSILLEKSSLGKNILGEAALKKNDFLKTFQENLDRKKNQKLAAPVFSEEIKKTLTRAYSVARNFNYPYVGTEHLVYALMENPDQLPKNFSSSVPKNPAGALFEKDQLSQISRLFNLPDFNLSLKEKQKKPAFPFIEKFCFNVNRETQRKNEITIGREKELTRIIQILGRKNKNNPLLIGEPGVGKTALISGLAQRINAGNVPEFLFGKTLMNLDVAQLIAGTSFRGEFEGRLKEIIREASQNKNLIIFIDEIHTIIGAGNVAGGLDLANILKPALSRGEIQIIGATTLGEYKKHVEKDAALERRFQPVLVKEPTPEETREILLGIRKNYEEFHNVVLSEESLDLAVELSLQYVQGRFLPDKAIDIIDETAAYVRSKNKISDFTREIKEWEKKRDQLLDEKEKLVFQENYEKAIELRQEEKKLEEKIQGLKKSQAQTEKKHSVQITRADLIETVAKISGIPAEKLAQEKSQRLKNIRKILSAQIIGQKEALEKLSNALLRSQSGIANPDRPIGSFLFLGPTGVGKTLTAKVLAQEFFGESGSLIRIDMSELMERHSVASLIGSPAGYVGYGEGGNLTEKIRRNPYSVVLFDEIEKAHPDVFNLLLQILEDGTLTDAQGLQVNFKNTLVILTSNIGTEDFTRAAHGIGFGYTQKGKGISQKFKEIEATVIKELETKMKPELLNRLDHILVFQALDKKSIEKIVFLELKKLSRRILKQGIHLKFDPSVVQFLKKKSVSQRQGARLVRKNVQELLENRIAEMLVYDKVKGNKIQVRVKNQRLILS